MQRAALRNLACSLALILACASPAAAQTVRSIAADGITDANLQDYLIGTGVTVDSWSRVGDTRQFGIFDHAPPVLFPFSRGLILSTGNVESLGTTNTVGNMTLDTPATGDPDFGAGSRDAAIINMTITPQGDTLFIDYVFGSEEYREYVLQGFSDNMRLFVNGANCALVPGTSADVSIDTINSTVNPAFFRDNDRFTAPASGNNFPTEMDGFTTTLRCQASVTPGAQSTVKLGIADVGDGQYDSWLLIKYRSFNADRDQDGIPDSEEDPDQTSDPDDPCDPNPDVAACTTGDPDHDSVLNGVECPDLTDCADHDNLAPVDYLDGCYPNASALGCATGDFDGDGVSNGVECPDPDSCPNSDGAGNPDYDDLDSDGDTILDSGETAAGRTNPCAPNANALACPTGDFDGDGTLNGVELPGEGSDPCEPSSAPVVCASGDADGDGHSNGSECATPLVSCPNSDGQPDGADWNDLDSDGDTTLDGAESAADRTNPCAPNANALACPTGDFDGDGTLNGAELPGEGSDPCEPSSDVVQCASGDADGDGHSNGSECAAPLVSCPNTDGLPDGADWNDTDSDGDTTLDGGESVAGRTNPCAPNANALACPTGDFDGDGTLNGAELPGEGSDPCEPSSDVVQCASGDADGDGHSNGSECATPLVSCPNSDGLPDGADWNDTDSDGDTALDADESAADRTDPCAPNADALTCPTGDFDGDGTQNGDELPGEGGDPCEPSSDVVQCASGDADGDGHSNGTECATPVSCPNTDGLPDGADWNDTDSDGDTTLDGGESVAGRTDPCAPNANALTCPTGDADGDGTQNGDELPGEGSDPCEPSSDVVLCASGDSDGDGIANGVECADPSDCADSDRDGGADYSDTDSDGDGTFDASECSDDAQCEDADEDGLPDFVESQRVDSDGDGLTDDEDSDADGDGSGDEAEAPARPWLDADGDTIPDHLDAADDSASEVGDSDGDGLPDDYECVTGHYCVDSDRDRIPDYADVDSDADGAGDDLECGGSDECGDADGDGVPDHVESEAVDTDGDGTADELDTDADGDGEGDQAEGAEWWRDGDGDAIPDLLDADSPASGAGDSDADGVGDDVECPTGLHCADTDGDATPDYMDLDSDGDGVPDRTDSLRRNPCVPDRDALACPEGDADGDGTQNGDDTAPEDECIPNGDSAGCASGDADGDGVSNGDDDVVADPCVPDEDNLSCPSGDFDGDGVQNGDDEDAEDECVPNACDGPGPGPGPGPSPDGGMPVMPGERPEHDADGDGLSDEYECSDDDELQRRLARRVGGAVPEVDGCPDSDGDGLADRDDDDSDGDGLLDAEECRGGVPCPDGDRDGIPDVLEPGAVALVGGACAVGGDPRDAAGSWLSILVATFALARKRRRPEQTL